jgi:nitrogen fixation NifU-like protein
MSATEHELYRQALLEHVRRPRNSGKLEFPDLRSVAVNPLCGDELEVTVALDGENIRDIRVQVRACAFTQASASLMSVLVSGISLAEAAALSHKFKSVMESASEQLPVELDSLSPLLEINRHRSRVRCVLLSWEALNDCIAERHQLR